MGFARASGNGHLAASPETDLRGTRKRFRIPLLDPSGNGEPGVVTGFGPRPSVHRRRTSPRGLTGLPLASRDGSDPQGTARIGRRIAPQPFALLAQRPAATRKGFAARDLIRGDAWNPGEGLPSHAQDRKVPREPAPGYHPHPVFGRSGDGNVAGAKPPRGRLDGNGGSRTDRLAGRQGKRAATPRVAAMGARPACRRTHATGSTGGSGWTDGGTRIPRMPRLRRPCADKRQCTTLLAKALWASAAAEAGASAFREGSLRDPLHIGWTPTLR